MLKHGYRTLDFRGLALKIISIFISLQDLSKVFIDQCHMNVNALL